MVELCFKPARQPSQGRRQPRQKQIRKLQERLLDYAAGKFENDPFRHRPRRRNTGRRRYAAGDAGALRNQQEETPAARGRAQELKTFLETIPDALPAAFLGELRLSGKIGWNELCDACNRFYHTTA